MPENGWIWSCERQIASDPAESRVVVAHLLDELKRRKWTENDMFAVHLAFEEALINAIKHGNRQDISKRVEVCCRLKADRVQIRITDQGSGFDPTGVPDPTDDAHLEIPSGRGMMLMGCFMTSLEYNQKGNSVTMEKVRSAETEPVVGEHDEP